MSTNWDTLRDALAGMPQKDVHKVNKLVKKELHLRWQEREYERRVQGAAMQGMANVMAGVTWALACRQSLRRSKGHAPDVGKRPQSGEMWLPRELLYAVRHEVKERQWSPLTQPDARGCLQWLGAEASRKPVQDVGDDFEAGALFNVPSLKAVKFTGRMARGEAAITFEDSVHSKFDLGGES